MDNILIVDRAEKKIDACLNAGWHFADLFYAYCESKGIDDPEDPEQLTDVEYFKMERDCAEQIINGKLQGLRETVLDYIKEQIKTIWDE